MHNMHIFEVSPNGKQRHTGQAVGDDDILVEGEDADRTSIRVQNARLVEEAQVRKTPRPPWQ